MDPLGIVLVVFIAVVLAYQYFSSGSSQQKRPTDEERATAARERRSQAYNDVLADFAAGRISTAQRDAQLGHVAKWPIESGPDGRR